MIRTNNSNLLFTFNMFKPANFLGGGQSIMDDGQEMNIKFHTGESTHTHRSSQHRGSAGPECSHNVTFSKPFIKKETVVC